MATVAACDSRRIYQSAVWALPGGRTHRALLNVSHAARCPARHGVGSKAEPVALIAQCSVALTSPSPLLRLPLRRLCVGRHLAVSPLVLKGVIHTGIPVAVFTHAAVLHHTSPLVSILVNETPGK